MAAITDFVRSPLVVRTPDFLLTSRETGPLFSLRGQDKQGKHWQVVLRDSAGGAWRSETNGSRTYYFAGGTGATGSGPSTWILALSFDEGGRPVPFHVTTHGGYEDKGIEDVLDLDGSGPELLVQDYWGNIREDPGYYVTTLYQQRGCYWHRSDGRHGMHSFPTFEKWSVMWKNRQAVLVAGPPSKRSVRDSSNDPAFGIHANILGAEENAVRVSGEVGCKEVFVEVLVRDSAEGRKIDLQPQAQSLTALASTRAEVVLTGLYHWPKGGECDASILWASTGR
jgi:hypothetical protein